MHMIRHGRWLVAALAMLIAGVALAACGSSGSSSSTSSSSESTDSTTSSGGAKSVNVGTMDVPMEGDKLKVAFFQEATNNSYLQAQGEAASSWAAEHPEVELTEFDGKFDPETQLNQIQDALQSGGYNAFLAAPVDPALQCKALSQEAPEDGVVVSILVQALCDKSLANGEELWTPGTLNFVGGTATPSLFKKYMEWVVEQNPGPQKVIVLTGPELNSPAEAFKEALGEIEEEFPDFEVVGQEETDFSVPVSEEKMAGVIQANPDATIFLSEYSNLTRGGVAALKAADALGPNLKIYDSGGTEWSKQAVENGTIEATTPVYVSSPVEAGLESLLNAFKTGEHGPRFIKNDGVALPAGADPETGLVIYTKKNISELKPEAE